VNMTPQNCRSLLESLAAPAPRYLMRIALLDQMIDMIPGTPESFLEIGPGMGDVSLYLTNRYTDIQATITDISETSIETLRSRFGDNPRATLAVSDFNNITGSARFDLIIACEVFEHLDDDNAAFQSVFRLLKPGGHFIFSVPAFMKKWGPADKYAGHVRRYEQQELRQQFQDNGFDIREFWSYGFPVTNFLSPVSKLYYYVQQRRTPLAGKDATQRSGTERSAAKKVRKLPYVLLMKPFFLVQDLTRKFNIGDGYIVLARKSS